MERTLRGDEPQAEAGHPSETRADRDLTDAAFIDEFDEQDSLHRAQYDSGQATPSFTVITVVSKIIGKDPWELDPLQGSIDADALDALFGADRSSEGQLTFQYNGFEITVRTGGVIEVVAG